MVLGHIDVAPRGEDCVHDLSVASDLLFVPGREGLDVEIGEQTLNLLIGEPASLDACRRADALDGGDAAEGGQTLRGDASECAPCAFVLVDLGDDREKGRGDAERLSLDHIQFYTQ